MATVFEFNKNVGIPYHEIHDLTVPRTDLLGNDIQEQGQLIHDLFLQSDVAIQVVHDLLQELNPKD